jgi:hypothetical protein
MNTVYTYAGMAVIWGLAAVLAILLSRLAYHTVYTMVKAVDFMRFLTAVSVRLDPEWRWNHNVLVRYAAAVRLMWREDGDEVKYNHANGDRYHAFNWK